MISSFASCSQPKLGQHPEVRGAMGLPWVNTRKIRVALGNWRDLRFCLPFFLGFCGEWQRLLVAQHYLPAQDLTGEPYVCCAGLCPCCGLEQPQDWAGFSRQSCLKGGPLGKPKGLKHHVNAQSGRWQRSELKLTS